MKRCIFFVSFLVLFAAATHGATNSAMECLPCRMALAAHEGGEQIDEQIRSAQEKARTSAEPAAALEQLGWLFVAKARVSYDDGFYKLAEQTAICLATNNPGNLDAQLLLGHIEQSLHHFSQAEVIARGLVTERGRPFDYGLLGDTLMDQGRVDEAVDAYQRMVDLKPDLQAYARAAHARWILGDLDGAIEASAMAARAASPRDPSTAAWALTRHAQYLFQAGREDEARAACEDALGMQPDFAAALLLKGRMLLAGGNGADALAVLRRAAELNPLPDYQWTLADALRFVGKAADAESVEAELQRRGAASDPRTLVLFLATRGEHVEQALALARKEMEARQDVFTKDALAWALFANDRTEDAWKEMQDALAVGTSDARLFLHAAVIARADGRDAEAANFSAQAMALRHTLLPSERDVLEQNLAERRAQRSAAVTETHTGE